MKERPAAGSRFFRAFPSDRISKATKNVRVYFFTVGIPVNYTRESREVFEATTTCVLARARVYVVDAIW